MGKKLLELLVVAALGGVLSTPVPAQPAASSASQILVGAKAALDSTRYAAADSLANGARALLEAESHPDPTELGTAHLIIARARLGQRILADSVAHRSALRALELFEQATPRDDLGGADAHDALAALLNEEEHSDRALEHATQALAIRRERLGDVDVFTTSSYYRLGTTLKRLGRADSALAVLRTGLDFRLRLDRPKDRMVGDFHSDISVVLENMGRLDEARAELEAMLREYETRLSPTHTAMCQGLQRYGTFEFHNGDVARSIDLTQRAVRIAEASPGYSPSNLALLRGNLAVSLMDLGDYSRARRLVQEALPVFEQRLGPRHRQTLWAKYMLGLATAVAGDTLAAVEMFQGVCRTLESDSTLTDTSTLSQARLAIAELQQDSNTKSAVALVEKGEATERARPVPNRMWLVNAESLHLRLAAKLGDWDAVDRLSDRVERDLDEFALRGSKAHVIALTEQCEAAAWRGRRSDAVRFALEASRLARQTIVENMRALPDRQGMSLAAARCEPLDVLVEQASAPGSGDAATAWDELIHWRGLVGAEIANRREPRGEGLDETALRAHAEWIEAQRRLAQYEVRVAGGRDAQAGEALAALRANASDAEHRWAAAAPRAAAATAPTDVGLEQVRSSLGPDAALVAFTTVNLREKPIRLFAFATLGRDVSPSGSKAVLAFDLGEIATISETLTRWRALAGKSPRGDPQAERACREAGLRLRALTWDVFAPTLAGARDVYLIPEGPLHALPWGALPDDERGYLVETDTRLHVLDAERDLLPSNRADVGTGLLALGGVDFEGGSSAGETTPLLQVASMRAVLQDCTGVPSAFPPLPETSLEVDAIEREWTSGGAEVLRGAEATETMFKLLAPGRRVLHLATHGVVLEDSCEAAESGTRGVGGVAPLESVKRNAELPVDTTPSPWLGRRVFLALAGASHAREHERDENEGLLTAEEVTTLDLRGTDWVVLSACQSGVADVWNREGRLGMTRAFHLAGARSVIASQWPVDDESTREWMIALYAARREGAVAAGDAIQRASRSILASRRTDGRSTHPFYWAAFTASGD